MRSSILLASVVAVAGCATQPPPRVVARRPLHRVSRPAVPAERAASPAPKPVRLDPPTPAPDGPGANVPLEGFRPMRNQTRPGA